MAAPPGTRVHASERDGWAASSWSAHNTEHTWQLLDVLGAVAAECRQSLSRVALRWLLQKPAVVAPVMGVRTMQQLEDNLGASAFVLSHDQMRRLDAASQVRRTVHASCVHVTDVGPCACVCVCVRVRAASFRLPVRLCAHAAPRPAGRRAGLRGCGRAALRHISGGGPAALAAAPAPLRLLSCPHLVSLIKAHADESPVCVCASDRSTRTPQTRGRHVSSNSRSFIVISQRRRQSGQLSTAPYGSFSP